MSKPNLHGLIITEDDTVTLAAVYSTFDEATQGMRDYLVEVLEQADDDSDKVTSFRQWTGTMPDEPVAAVVDEEGSVSLIDWWISHSRITWDNITIREMQDRTTT